MCYSGRCVYEDHMGDCKLLNAGKFPECPEELCDTKIESFYDYDIEIESLRHRINSFRLSYDNEQETYEVINE